MDKLAYEVEPGFLYGRPGPAKSLWNLTHLRKNGIRAIFSLVPTPTDAVHEMKRLGIAHYEYPVEEKVYRLFERDRNFLFPLLDRFDKILAKHLPRREAVLVHCNSGKNRTGLLMCYYLMTRRQLPLKAALKELRRMKPKALNSRGYEDLLSALEPEIQQRWQERAPP